MSSLTIRIETNNAAFGDDPGPEVVRMLRDFCDRTEVGQLQYNRFIDQNGDDIGGVTIADESMQCDYCDAVDTNQHDICSLCGILVCDDCTCYRVDGRPLCPDCSVG